MTQKTVKIEPHVDLALLLGIVQANVQRSINRVAFGLHAANAKDESPLDIPGGLIQLVVYPSEHKFDDLKANFTTWIIANGLRDCIETLDEFLIGVRQICAFWHYFGPPGTRKFPYTEWKEKMYNADSDFRRWPLPRKFKELKRRFGFDVPKEEKEDILSINLIRRCLVHGNGIVTDEFKNTRSGLRASRMAVPTRNQDL